MSQDSPLHRAYIGLADQYDLMGALQFDLLCTLGMRSEHKVLDLGCGGLRAGRFLILYLGRGNYFGIEPNEWLVRDAITHELGQSLIDLKQPRFSNRNDFNIDEFGTSFDFILAQSIFSHTGPDLLEQALSQIKKNLVKSGLALVTFIHPSAKPAAPKEKPGWSYPQGTTYAPERILDYVSKVGLTARSLPWHHPRGQTWYALAHNEQALPSREDDRFLLGKYMERPLA